MFGKNTITGRKFFQDDTYQGPTRLYVTSIFYTFQGEGPHTGKPALFIRLARCNLNCQFCDAYFEEGDWMTVDEILTRARDLILDGAEVGEDTVKDFARLKVGLVLTGGEPMLQDDAVAELFTVARNNFAWHQIETNGTQNIKTIPKFVDVVVSPKCLEKSGKAVRYLEVHQSCLDRATCLKFVVSADPESPYHDIPDYAKKSSLPIYVSPMNIYTRLPAKALRFDGTKAGLEERSTTDEVISFWEEGLLDRDANKANHEYAARLAVKRGYMFNLQQHLYGSMA